ncbi:TauD/TfdA family dioxygenase [Larkinella soli]|uniref:TauD/TfdA family dioxygenase n=1 Tax=Larkinella soli TaxID=1770527 RepID=UPI000FFB4FAD|nr:TauD/TfdA family dioxygenase [Larkinella soli]
MNYFQRVTYTTPEETIQNVKEAVLSSKLVHLADFPSNTPVDQVHEFYSQLSETIGRIHAADEDIATGKATGNRWIDITFDPNIPDRYRSSNTRQPMHTDDSYVELNGEEAVNFFYCASQAKIGGATTFFDLPALVECMKLDGEENLLEELLSTEVVFSKGGSRKVRKILDEDEDGYLANWNYYCIDRKENSAEVLALCERFHQFLELRIVQSGVVDGLQLKKGEAAFFHDDRVLHGRHAFFAEYPGQRSLIKGKIILNPAHTVALA